MKSHFNFFMPTRLLFGPGRLEELSMAGLPGRRALVVIGASGAMRGNGHLDRVLTLLDEAGVEAEVFDRIVPNPLDSHVDEGAGVYRSRGCDFVIGLGGGSTLDSAKAIALAAPNGGRFWDYIPFGSGGRKIAANAAAPFVAIPTTAGTGSEADPWMVITNEAERQKIGWGRDDTYPVLSIIDPELMLSVPPDVTAHSGMDALFHAVECYVSSAHQPASDFLCVESVSLVMRNLAQAVRDGGDVEARGRLAWASTEAGICQSLSSVTALHSIEHALSAFYPAIQHGAGLAMLSEAFFTFLAPHEPRRFTALAKIMGEDVEGLDDARKPLAFVDALGKLKESVGLKGLRLSSYGVRDADVEPLAHNARETMGVLFSVTPAPMTHTEVCDILRASL